MSYMSQPYSQPNDLYNVRIVNHNLSCNVHIHCNVSSSKIRETMAAFPAGFSFTGCVFVTSALDLGLSMLSASDTSYEVDHVP